MFSLKAFFSHEQSLSFESTPNGQKIALNFFMVGLIILGFGLALIPSSIYYKLLIIVIYLPALYLIITNYKPLVKLIKSMPILWCYILLMLWTLISLFWAREIDLAREIKFPLLISLFCFGCLIFTLKSTLKFEQALLLIAFSLALSALIAMLYSPWNPPFYTFRMTAFNRLENPILAGYAMGIAFIILYAFLNTHRTPLNFISAITLLILLTFIIWTKSRGAIGGVLIYLLLTPIWNRAPRNFLLTFIILIGTIIFLLFFSHIMLDRGLSFRPLILRFSTELMFTHPFVGLGFATNYAADLKALGFPIVASHAHNLFLHIGITLGIPALLLFIVLWLNTAWQAWKHRKTSLGQVLIGIFIYSSIALQFDGVYIWSKPNAVWLMTWLPLVIGFYLSAKDKIKASH